MDFLKQYSRFGNEYHTDLWEKIITPSSREGSNTTTITACIKITIGDTTWYYKIPDKKKWPHHEPRIVGNSIWEDETITIPTSFRQIWGRWYKVPKNTPVDINFAIEYPTGGLQWDTANDYFNSPWFIEKFWISADSIAATSRKVWAQASSDELDRLIKSWIITSKDIRDYGDDSLRTSLSREKLSAIAGAYNIWTQASGKYFFEYILEEVYSPMEEEIIKDYYTNYLHSLLIAGWYEEVSGETILLTMWFKTFEQFQEYFQTLKKMVGK